MAGKLYPPYIDGKVPAFCGTVLKVPFRHNRGVSYATQVTAMSCKIKTVSTNEWVWTLQTSGSNIQKDPETGQWYALFDLSQTYKEREDPKTGTTKPYYQWLTVGVFYKIQIAYVDNSKQVGYFSDVGVTKYTTQPSVTIDGLNKYGTNNALYNYVGVYSQYNGDTAEREYSYCFTLYDNKGNVFLTSGEKIHNSSLDTESYESRDEFRCNKELTANKIYKLKYVVTTINGMVSESQSYILMKKDTVRPQLNAILEAEVNYDDGFIELKLNSLDDRYYSGNFAIARSSSIDNFQTWDEICQFSLNREAPMRNLLTDFTVEQGVSYCYSLQQYNTKGLYSNRMKSNIVVADFEDMFLFDGERQLKIRFNPTVSSFKNDILENKTDTIGGKYPFIFRNGNVNYKEFPIGGLISYLQDDQEYFMKREDLGPLEFVDTNLTSENIRAERLFKLEVMEWLTNGKPKLFKSPTEGNYLVRLLNTSLSPNTTTGRMLHSFTATAYEVGSTEFQSLLSYGLFKTPDLETSIMRFKTVFLNDIKLPKWVTDKRSTYLRTPPAAADVESKGGVALPDIPGCYLGVFEGVAPDTLIGLRFLSNSGERVTEYIRIGETQVYQVNAGDNTLVGVDLVWTPNISRELEADRTFDGSFTFGYYSSAYTDNFSQISNFDVEDRMSQFFGLHKDIIAELEDIRSSVGHIYWMKVLRRDIKNVYISTTTADYGKMYYDESHLSPVRLQDVLPTSVYADVRYDPVRYYSGHDILRTGKVYKWSGDNITDLMQMSRDLYNNRQYYWTPDTKDVWGDDPDLLPADRLYKFAINHADYNVDLKTIGRYIITDLDQIQSLSLGRMLMVDIYYQMTYKTYSVEESNYELSKLRLIWAQAQETFLEEVQNEAKAISTKSQGEQYLKNLLENEDTGLNDRYAQYIEKLEQILAIDEEG